MTGTALAQGYHDVPPGHLAMVVTHLEMRAPAAPRAATEPEGFALVEKPRPELDWYRDLFRRVGAPWLWFGRLVMDDDRLAAILYDPGQKLYVLERAGRAEAICELDFRTPGECELAYFGLTDALIGTGAGRFLMNHAIATAWAEPIERLHVHTCTLDSPAALEFYIRSGFTPVRRQVELAPDPRLTGLLPEDCAPQVPLLRP